MNAVELLKQIVAVLRFEIFCLFSSGYFVSGHIARSTLNCCTVCREMLFSVCC